MSSAVRRSPIRLARPYSPIPIAVLVLFVWWVVAHNSGSGWVQVLGEAVFGILLVGLFAPAAALARIRVDISHAPSDGVASAPIVLALHCSRRARITPVEPEGPETFLGRTSSGTDTELILLPPYRGVHDALVLDVATAAPFGLQWWARTLAIELPAPLHVAPKLGRPVRFPDWLDERAGLKGPANRADAGDARGVRNYRPGDRRQRVHWGATAHAGRLMVREMEEPTGQPVTLRVAVPVEVEAAERTAESALGTVVILLDRALSVVLATDESHGHVVKALSDRREAGRRLARAIGVNEDAVIEILP